jgi:phage shock protein C
MKKELRRIPTKGQISGVCAGLSEHFNIDVTIVRLIFVVATLLGLWGIPVYIILLIVIPVQENYINQKPQFKDEKNENEDEFEYDEDEFKW